MPYSNLPNEIIFNISRFLKLDFDLGSGVSYISGFSYRYTSDWSEDENDPLYAHQDVEYFLAWIQTLKRHAAVLTPVLLNHAFKFTPALRQRQKENRHLQRRAKRLAARIWEVSQFWESLHLADYLPSRRTECFWYKYLSKNVPLLEALIRAGSLKMLEILLDDQEFRGTRLGRDGDSPHILSDALCIASDYDHDDIQVVRTLLNAGADVAGCNSYGFSPLHIVAKYQHLEFVNLLLDFGGNIWAMTEGNGQPSFLVEMALKQLQNRPEVAHRLLDPTLQTEDEKSPWDWKLHVAHSAFFIRQCSDTDAAEFVRVLLDSGVNLFAMNSRGTTILETVEDLGKGSSVMTEKEGST
ncbi:ankyrin repeat-containing domain protein [Aspergillus multicolor]|uniref:ankyrin repeat domain-containing protein n=1 Tax=Aspergillus multicolor TaxID=41759 RepID=UPI003CCCC898